MFELDCIIKDLHMFFGHCKQNGFGETADIVEQSMALIEESYKKEADGG